MVAVEIDEKDLDKTALTSHHGLCRYIGMPFVLWSTPGTFQRIMDVILSSMKLQISSVSLDRTVLIFKSHEQLVHVTWICVERMDRARKVLTLLKNEGKSIKRKNSQSFAGTVHFWGHVMHPKRLEIGSHPTDAICRLRALTILTDVRNTCFRKV